MSATLRWERVRAGVWRSVCGRYEGWIQARPRGEGAVWNALVVVPGAAGGGTWLCGYEGGLRREAIAACEAHASAAEVTP